MNHEDHETPHEDCTACQAEMEASYREAMGSAPRSMSRVEREEIEADRELMLDEFHGRNIDGNLTW